MAELVVIKDEVSVESSTGPLTAENISPIEVQEAKMGVWEMAWATNKGEGRKENEDRVEVVIQEGVALGVVADGVGGRPLGERASDMATRSVAQALTPDVARVMGGSMGKYLNYREWMQEQIHGASEEVKAVTDNLGRTTVVAALIVGEMVRVFNVGDSRAGVVGKDGEIKWVTKDHTIANDLVRKGTVANVDQVADRFASLLTRSVGGDHFEPEMFEVRLGEGERLVLCTDGLSNNVDGASIADVVRAAGTCGEATKNLIKKADEKGREGNIAVLVVECRGTK